MCIRDSPYIFDVAGTKELADERDIEKQLVEHVTRYLLEIDVYKRQHIMKKLFMSVALLLLVVTSFAQTPGYEFTTVAVSYTHLPFQPK